MIGDVVQPISPQGGLIAPRPVFTSSPVLILLHFVEVISESTIYIKYNSERYCENINELQ